MTSHPPMFASQAAEQKLWNDGFKAGISEAIYEMRLAQEAKEGGDGLPSLEWVELLAEKISRKYQ